MQEQREKLFCMQMRKHQRACENSEEEWIGASRPATKSHSGRTSFAVEVQRCLVEHGSSPEVVALGEQHPCWQVPGHFLRNWPLGQLKIESVGWGLVLEKMVRPGMELSRHNTVPGSRA